MIIYFITFLNNTLIGQESYLLKKKNIDIEDSKNYEKENINSKKPIQKKNAPKDSDKVEKNIEAEKKITKQNELKIINEKEFRIIYKPNQAKLNESALINVIELSNKIDKKSMIVLKSYASKNDKQGSSDARRLSLSRALEIRKIFIENEIPAINISIKALGTKENTEGFTDIIVISTN